MLMKLPGSGQLEYLIMTPFTPQKRKHDRLAGRAMRLPRLWKDAVLRAS